MRTLLSFATLLLLTAGISACGNKGPLVPADPEPPKPAEHSTNP